MKLKLTLLEHIRECTRKSQTRPLALNPMIESLFILHPPRPANPHEHVLQITSSGFTFLSSFEQFQVELPASMDDFSHFAFRNSVIFMVNLSQLEDDGQQVLAEESAREIQIFMAHYLSDVWRCDSTVAITIDRNPVSRAKDEDGDWLAFSVAAILPVPADEWKKTLEIKKKEIEWAEQFLEGKDAKAAVTAAEFIDKLKMH